MLGGGDELMCGGLGEAQPANDEVKRILENVKADIHAKAGTSGDGKRFLNRIMN
jgi:hypothetical protein